jgi:hypothetical protein
MEKFIGDPQARATFLPIKIISTGKEDVLTHTTVVPRVEVREAGSNTLLFFIKIFFVVSCISCGTSSAAQAKPTKHQTLNIMVRKTIILFLLISHLHMLYIIPFTLPLSHQRLYHNVIARE